MCRPLLLLATAICFLSYASGQNYSFLDAFDEISDQPVFLMSNEINADIPERGHLQGIQVVGTRVFISGSSNEQGYIAVFKGDGVKLDYLGIKTLSEKPFTHAGGFQIEGNWMAVGCEDPVGMKQSMVILQDVTNSRTISGTPAYVLKRDGIKKLATAGAVGLIIRKDHFLLAVASWDAHTIDFYTSNHTYPSKSDFEFTFWTTWDKETSRHKGWANKRVPAYQNIQLFEDGSGLYLVGTGIDTKGRHLADAYYIDPKKDKYDMLTKVRSREFHLPGSASFRNGAGIVQSDGKLSLWAVGKHLKPKTFVVVFPAKE